MGRVSHLIYFVSLVLSPLPTVYSPVHVIWDTLYRFVILVSNDGFVAYNIIMIVYSHLGDSGGERWDRGCSNLEKDSCLEPTKEPGLTTTICYCKGDACNRAPGLTLSSALLTLCMSWAALRSFYLLFWPELLKALSKLLRLSTRNSCLSSPS